MIEIEFVGAAQTVTGSKHLIRTSQATVLLDCGLYQGRRAEALERNQDLGLPVRDLDAVVLSHAHIDHSGALPLLVKSGYSGAIHLTPATRDLCVPMLTDAAMIQAADAAFIGRLIRKGNTDLIPVEPLYSVDDVDATIALMQPLPYDGPRQIAPGITVRLLDAGHVLGSAIVVLDIDEDEQVTRLAFSGDLGRKDLPLLRDPVVPGGVHALLLESTYGDRHHDPIERMDDSLMEAIADTIERGGKVLIPSFALERAQEVVFALKRLRKAGRLPRIPVYVDSPLTVRLTGVFKQHPECYDQEVRAMLEGDDSPFEFDGLTYVSSVEQSMVVAAETGPAVIISASGMCEGGRVLHHLKAMVGDPRNTLLFVGFQAQHTLGRRLVEGRPEVRVFGMNMARRAQVVSLHGFSAHADQGELLGFAEAVRRKGPLRQIALVHGEAEAQQVLRGELEARGFAQVTVPAPGERLRL
jgi:metallo-beta-lactamase family protein